MHSIIYIHPLTERKSHSHPNVYLMYKGCQLNKFSQRKNNITLELWFFNVFERNLFYNSAGGLLTVYVFKLEMGSAVPLYRYSLSASVPAPWQASSAGHGDVPFFQVCMATHIHTDTNKHTFRRELRMPLNSIFQFLNMS